MGSGGTGGTRREVAWAGRGHAIVDRLVSVVFRFEFEGLAGQSESDPMAGQSESDPTIVRSDCHIDPTERSSERHR